MAELNYAMLKNSIVQNIIVLDEPSQETINYFKELHGVDDIILVVGECFINSEYDNNSFWNPSPYPSWIKDYEVNAWRAPVDIPQDENPYFWDETKLSWVMLDIKKLKEYE
jgi:hypothetical protein